MNTQEAENIIDGFSGKKVVIIGDLMLDAYLWGQADRISPEAPVPVVNIIKEEFRLGGAANVALNIKTLGAEPILLSVVGDDLNGKNLCQILEDNGIQTHFLIKDETRKTTVKSRIFSHNQQMVRFDYETQVNINESISQKIIQNFSEIIHDIDVVIFEDYDKGVLHDSIIKAIISLCNKHNIPTTADPKKKNFFSYEGITLFKPNLKEICEGLNTTVNSKDIESIKLAVQSLEEHLNNRISFLTLAADGIFVKDADACEIIPTVSKKVSDVSGAGDTVISIASLCLSQHLDSVSIAKLSNIGASIVCQKLGVSPIKAEELKNKLAVL